MAQAERDRPDLSIIFGTYNRLDVLKQCIEHARASAYPLIVEFVIADGGSTDGTLEYLRNEPDVTLIEQGGLFGACQAFTECCQQARAEYVAHLNDDALCMGNCLVVACKFLDNHPDVGQAALAFRDVDAEDRRYRTGMILDRHYANFGVVRRWLGEYVGWFSGGYLTYSCDQEFSFKIWEQGYKVAYLGGCRIEHLRVCDKLRDTWAHDHGEPTAFLARWKERVGSFPTEPIITREKAGQIAS